MNDPNGMFVDADGVYHLYYQCELPRPPNNGIADHLITDNPTANVAGEQHWGHATSTDLFTWRNQQIALFPGSEDEGVFSGSAVIDANNTSGMFVSFGNLRIQALFANKPIAKSDQRCSGFVIRKLHVKNWSTNSNSYLHYQYSSATDSRHCFQLRWRIHIREV